MLIDFFLHLRRHKLPCSLRELLDLHGALAAGLASVDMDDFYRLSRCLLVKDEAQFDKFDRAFAAYFKGVEMLTDFSQEIPLEWLQKHLELELSAEDKAKVVHAIAMGAVKYADLSKNRTTDYIFDWDMMLSFEGNTAPYLQYAYTRIQSIFRKAGVDADTLSGKVVLSEDAEETLAQKLIQFSDAVNGVADKGMPHLLCTYLYELSGNFMTFYEACPINKDGVDEATRNSRLLLCVATAKVLKLGLGVLGIYTLERM